MHMNESYCSFTEEEFRTGPQSMEARQDRKVSVLVGVIRRLRIGGFQLSVESN